MDTAQTGFKTAVFDDDIAGLQSDAASAVGAEETVADDDLHAFVVENDEVDTGTERRQIFGELHKRSMFFIVLAAGCYSTGGIDLQFFIQEIHFVAGAELRDFGRTGPCDTQMGGAFADLLADRPVETLVVVHAVIQIAVNDQTVHQKLSLAGV